MICRFPVDISKVWGNKRFQGQLYLNMTSAGRPQVTLDENYTGEDVGNLSRSATLECLTAKKCGKLKSVKFEKAKNLVCLHAESCGKLKVIDVSSCCKLESLTVTKCKNLKEVHGLPDACELLALNLSGCGKLEQVEGLCATNIKVKKLNLSGCKLLEPLGVLGCCKNVTELDLSGCKNINQSSMEIACKELNGLETLKLSGVPTVSDNWVWSLGVSNRSNANLLYLDLSRCLDIENAGPLSMIRSLKELSLDGCTSISKGLEAVCGLPNLKKLLLSKTKVTDECLENIKGNRNLVVLGCSGCLGISSISCIGEVKSLEELSLEGCTNIKKGLDILPRLPKLQKLWICGLNVPETIKQKLKTQGVKTNPLR
ncbi:leucine-rich repeat protein (LRRP), putative [Trypanosoma brucei brucei TREU927]|uniref:Leucine-rich repeat protein (LRRP), putative n=1 Tax=Trypanosoma brucei brucei (strain 927/4 GUTat10.1) TaxID=185431 RepID=Q386A8_TRYB2|nr:uncharacterized protein Tb11.02.1564 [Trypanosoma brucei brucei TREU927]EAN79373.1 leucine-rich repeat protein (LRRP), putative [Trypanosoma brucei brucei TREU927]